MIVCSEVSGERADSEFRKRALRDAVICIGWLKLVGTTLTGTTLTGLPIPEAIKAAEDRISVVCYVLLYFLVHSNSKGHMSNVLQIMILATIAPQVIHGVLLFLGALEEKIAALELSLWMCLIMASYNTVLGAMGCIYFIRTGHLTMHFLLAVSFAIMALSLFTVICHDILIVYSYKQMLMDSARPTASWDK